MCLFGKMYNYLHQFSYREWVSRYIYVRVSIFHQHSNDSYGNLRLWSPIWPLFELVEKVYSRTSSGLRLAMTHHGIVGRNLATLHSDLDEGSGSLEHLRRR